MTTMDDLYGNNNDPMGSHRVCPDCGWCLVCDACMCNWLKENPDMEGMRFPFVKEEKKP